MSAFWTSNMPIEYRDPWNRDGLFGTDHRKPHFRVLVCGQAGAGKSTLINKVFGIDMVILSLDSMKPTSD
jgi:polynucleotide 5'-kinase involved in rRNA processing